MCSTVYIDNERLLEQLTLLADSGFYFHLSRLINSQEDYQFIQSFFAFDYRWSYHPRGRGMTPYGYVPPAHPSDEVVLSGGVNQVVHLKNLMKLLGLPNLPSYIGISEFITELHRPFQTRPQSRCLRDSFDGFHRDPARSGGFYYDPSVWHAFVATRFLRFLASSSSQ
jgi:hypothetical protein